MGSKRSDRRSPISPTATSPRSFYKIILPSVMHCHSLVDLVYLQRIPDDFSKKHGNELSTSSVFNYEGNLQFKNVPDSFAKKYLLGVSNVFNWSEEHGDAVDLQELESTPLRSGNKGKVAVKVEDNEDVFEHGIVSRPKNPYFVTKLRQKRRRELFIPTDVIRDHGLELPKNLIILDEEGRKLSSNVIRWNDGRTWLTKGWKAFCKRNNLELEDRCICEFVHGEGSEGIYLKMRVLREGSWLPKGGSQPEIGPSS
ncbi:hypothetical protein RHSIM_Rhsim11G0170700 [Rhododendron simsii]|uniref:TF-B3 domain-containing protein n=1 Tax=Rhododendron simsii TaxID=118357 RepID=A0A834G8W4_RHOSS|nr:hypothetical protein RHSIM_Rhsim11G0170700 [Rhododendron simsii]